MDDESLQAGGVAPAGWTSRRIVVVLVTAVVVASGALGGYWALSRGPGSAGPSGGNGTPPESYGPPSTTANVSAVHFTGEGVNVAVGPFAGLNALAVGADFNVSVNLTQDCGAFGCSPGILSIQVAPPFYLIWSQPALPIPFGYPARYGFPATAMAIIEVMAPSVPGHYELNGTIVAQPEPGPADVRGVTAVARYAGPDTGFFSAWATPPGEVRPNSTVTVNLHVQSSASNIENLSTLEVQAPFTLSSPLSSLPEEVPAGQTVVVSVSVTVPPPGNYTLNFTLGATTPLVTFGAVWTEVIVHPDPFYQFEPTLGPTPSWLRLGQQFVLNETFNNSDPNASHVFSISGISQPWTLASLSPSGMVTVEPDTVAHWTMLITAPTVPGRWDLVVIFQYWS